LAETELSFWEEAAGAFRFTGFKRLIGLIDRAPESGDSAFERGNLPPNKESK